MKIITQIKRLKSPAPLPQALTWDGSHFWVGSLETFDIYKLDPNTWEVLWQTKAPGMPFSIVAAHGTLHVLTSESDESDRYIRQLNNEEGFKYDSRIDCPDFTGSQLSFDGANLYLSQWYNQVVLKLDSEGLPLRTLSIPHGITGQVIVGDQLYLVTTDDEENGDYWLTRINFKDENPVAKDIAVIPFPARSLTHDGTHFWSNHRENHEIVCFTQ